MPEMANNQLLWFVTQHKLRKLSQSSKYCVFFICVTINPAFAIMHFFLSKEETINRRQGFITLTGEQTHYSRLSCFCSLLSSTKLMVSQVKPLEH